MLFRSTNNKFTHFQGDVLTNTDDSSHGIHLSGGTTGGVIQPCGDETNIALTVRGKGAGALSLGGTSTGAVTIGSSNSTVFMAGSTAPFSGFLRFTDTGGATPTAFNDTECGRVAETTNVLTGLSSQTPGAHPTYYLVANSPNLPAAVAIAGVWTGSTAGDVHVRLVKGSTIAVASATCTFNFLVVRM